MSETPNADKLAEAVQAIGIIDVVRKSENDKSVSLLCRVHQKRSWVGIVEYMLARRKGWTEHICQQYFMKRGKLKFGWNFIIRSDDIPAAVDNAVKLLRAGTKVVAREVARYRTGTDSMPLMGASNRRTRSLSFDPRLPGPDKGGPSHKGAFGIGE